MKYIILSVILVTLLGCSAVKSTLFEEERMVPLKTTLTHKAYYYYGLNETRDRELIKDIMGVDPVTTEWCAAFVNMVLLEQQLPTSALFSNYPFLARSFLDYGEEVTEPQQGDIVVFPRGNTEWQGHVGFYSSTSTLPNGTKVYNILGGNQNNSVNLQAYPASAALSIRRVTEAFLIDTSIRHVKAQERVEEVIDKDIEVIVLEKPIKESPSVAIETPIP
jgi:uncharacterized protein (TIGR02594 family)